MPVFMCQFHGSKQYGIVNGENRADAILKYDLHLQGQYNQDDEINRNDSINSYCEKLLTECDVTELYRALALEYIESKLDGDDNITVKLT